MGLRIPTVILTLATVSLSVAPPLSGATPSPAPPPPELSWAYPTAPNHTPELKTPPGVYRTPDGKRELTAAQVDALTAAEEDWFPQSHPTPPPIILKGADGRAPCAECHMVNGQGVVGVPDLAGLRSSYLWEQLNGFRSGTRKSAQPNRLSTNAMIETAKGWNVADLRAAVAYYAALPRHTPTRVVEADTSPPMRLERWGWTYVDPAGGQKRSLKGTVAEAPESVVKVYMGDLTNRQVFYASKATLALGDRLAHSGGGGGQPCVTCHGADFRGTSVAPPLAGRDPGYLARQLWDIRSGARTGPGVVAMQVPVRGLSPSDITAVTAYLAAQNP